MKISKKRFEKIYQQIANDKQTSIEHVKEEMQLAMDEAWNSNNANFRNLFPNGKPTLEEFLTTIKGEISKSVAY